LTSDRPKLKYSILIFLPLVFFSQIGAAGDYKLRIDLATCEPDGVINVWKERLNPKDFWINQSVVFKTDLSEMTDENGYYDVCRSISNNSERVRCFDYKKSLVDSARRCLPLIIRRCRQHGGFC
jgi:hypothetical protein